jgi:glutathione S-transferase
MPLAQIHGKLVLVETSRYFTVADRHERKVVIILKELDLPYETEFVDFAVIKQKPYTDINPNGRVPSITDPNTGITLWESAAIIEYLIDQYDKEGKLTYRKSPEKYYLQQYVYFQMSGEWYLHIFHGD